jgi:hypothetical protein
MVAFQQKKLRSNLAHPCSNCKHLLRLSCGKRVCVFHKVSHAASMKSAAAVANEEQRINLSATGAPAISGGETRRQRRPPHYTCGAGP